MALNTGSVQVDLDAWTQRKITKEISLFREFPDKEGVSFYNHMNQIADAAHTLNGLTPSTPELNKLDGVSSTGLVPTLSHYRLSASTAYASQSALASSARLRFVVCSSHFVAGQSSLYIPRSRLGLKRIVAAFAQVASSNFNDYAAVNLTRVVQLLVVNHTQVYSTLKIKQYAAWGVTPGSVVASTGGGNFHLLVLGY